MLQATLVKLAQIQPLGFSCIRQLHISNGIYSLQTKLATPQGLFSYQWSISSQMKHESTRLMTSSSNNSNRSMKQQQSDAQEKNESSIGEKKTRTPSALNCRVIQPAEFNSEFEDNVFRTFFCNEPMSMYLGLNEKDECIMPFLRQVLQRAKEDGMSLGIYDDNNKDSEHQDEKHLDSRGKGCKTQFHGSKLTDRSKLPVCYVINIIESIDDPPAKNDFAFDFEKVSSDKRYKYECVGDILTKVSKGIDLYSMYKARRLLQSFMAGVHPSYGKQGLFTRLKLATIELARAKNIDLLYSKATSQYSTRANLKLGYQAIRTIDYGTYKNAEGQHVFEGMSQTHKACTLTVKNLRT